MRFIIIALFVLGAVSALNKTQYEFLVKKINGAFETYTWEEFPFKDSNSETGFNFSLGMLDEIDESKVMPQGNIDNDLETEYTWHGKGIGAIRNQGACGSCWAVSAAEVISDRYFVESGSLVELSSQELVSCDKSSYGCNGGYVHLVWNYISTKGLRSEKCYPYTSGTTGENGKCYDNCPGEGEYFKITSKRGKQFVSREQIKKAIREHGPVQAGFTVYEDFKAYKGGVYSHTWGRQLGGHAIKIIGWSEEKKAWHCANSWGGEWGEEGFFWIQFGDSGIESRIYAGDAVVKKVPSFLE